MNTKNKQSGFSRRNLLKFGAAALGTGVVAAKVGSHLFTPEPAVAQSDLTPILLCKS